MIDGTLALKTTDVPEENPQGHQERGATRAVIGTLRPTERRRAYVFYSIIRSEFRGSQKIVPAPSPAGHLLPRCMELRGLEPLTSAMRMQRSPS